MNTKKLTLFIAIVIGSSCASVTKRPDSGAIACNVAVEIALGGINSGFHKTLTRRSEIPTLVVLTTDEGETEMAVAPNCQYPPLQFFSRRPDIPKDVYSLKVSLIPASKGLIIVKRTMTVLNRSKGYDGAGSSAGTDVYTREFIESRE